MEIVLLKEVAHLGKIGQKVHVKEGYARNFLFPRGLALPALASHLAQMEAVRSVQLRQAETLRSKASELSQRLNEVVCTIPMAVGTQGKLHGAVTSGDIVEALKIQGIVLEKHQVGLEKPITELGVYQVPVQLHREVNGTVKVQVIRK